MAFCLPLLRPGESESEAKRGRASNLCGTGCFLRERSLRVSAIYMSTRRAMRCPGGDLAHEKQHISYDTYNRVQRPLLIQELSTQTSSSSFISFSHLCTTEPLRHPIFALTTYIRTLFFSI